MHHPTDRIAHTTAFVTPVVEHWLERHSNSVPEFHGIACLVSHVVLVDYDLKNILTPCPNIFVSCLHFQFLVLSLE